MTRKFKNSTTLLLLLVFLLPSIVKLEHHHENTQYKAHHAEHYHVYHEKCYICEFEFSVFLADTREMDLQEENPLVEFCNHYESVNLTDQSQFSFLLRGPPSLQRVYDAYPGM